MLLSFDLSALLNPGPTLPPVLPFHVQSWNTQGGLRNRLDEASELIQSTPGGTGCTTFFVDHQLSKTETRLDFIRQALGGTGPSRAALFFSALSRDVKQKARRGICAVVNAPWAQHCTQTPIPLDLEGSALSLTFSHSTGGAIFLKVIGVYARPWDPATYTHLLTYLDREIAACKAAQAPNNPACQAPYHLLITGDFNAVHNPEDRHTGRCYQKDTAWQNWCSRRDLSPILSCTGTRPHTFRPSDDSLRTSRIDDAYCLPHTNALSPTCNIVDFCHTSDHCAIQTSLDLSPAGVLLPAADPPGAPNLTQTATKSIKTPIKPSILNKFEAGPARLLLPSIAAQHAAIKSARASLLQTVDQANPDSALRHPATSIDISNIFDGNTALDAEILEAAFSVCLPGGPTLQRACSWATGWLPRPLAAKRKALFSVMLRCRLARCVALRVLSAPAAPDIIDEPRFSSSASTAEPTDTPLDPAPAAWHEHDTVHRLANISFRPEPRANPQNTTRVGETNVQPPYADVQPTHPTTLSASPTAAECSHASPPSSWLRRLGTIRVLARKLYRTIMKSYTAKRAFQQLVHTHRRLKINAKKTHKRVLQPDTAAPAPTMNAVRRTDSPTVLSEPAAVLKEAAAQYGAAKGAPTAPPIGRAPWTNLTNGLTPCRLRTVPKSMRETPLQTYLTRETYDRCLSQLMNRRAAGPNGIPAELLKHMPPEYHNMLFDAFCLFLETGQAPPSWKHSETILLHKRGDPTVLKNWRPIGLADSAGKFYHAVLADCLYRYSACAGLLSDTQFGFRRDRNCQQALTYVLSLFEDSHACQRDLYVAYIDLCDAFGSLPQGRIVDVLQLLGLPPDALRAVQDMYTNATTSLRLPVGTSERIAFNRGTLQGDTLSPLIFLLFIEPLIQWINAEDHGYHPGCADHHINAHTDKPEPASSSVYADDMLLLSRSLVGLQTMLRKLEAYCEWAGLAVNIDKSAVSGLEHKPPPGQPSLLQRCKRFATIKGEPLPYLPPTSTYKYLGVDISLTLNTSAHAKKLVAEVSRRLEAISATPLFASDSLQCMRSLVVSVISYSLPLGVLKTNDIEALQKLLLRFCRTAYGLPTCIAREALIFPKAAGGLEFPDIDSLATAIVADACLDSLADAGRLGRLSRSLARMQLFRAGNSMDYVASRGHWPHSPWLDKLGRLHRAGLELTGVDCILTSPFIHNFPATHLSRCRALLSPLVQETAAQHNSSPHPSQRGKARAGADQALYTTLQTLLDLGIHSLHQLINDSATGLRTATEFSTAFPAAATVHVTAYQMLLDLCLKHASVMAQCIHEASQIRADCSLPLPPLPPPLPPPPLLSLPRTQHGTPLSLLQATDFTPQHRRDKLARACHGASQISTNATKTILTPASSPNPHAIYSTIGSTLQAA